MSAALSGFISPMQRGGDGYTHATLSVKAAQQTVAIRQTDRHVFAAAVRLYTAHCGHQTVSAIPVPTFATSANAAICRVCVLAVEAEQRRRTAHATPATKNVSTLAGGNKP